MIKHEKGKAVQKQDSLSLGTNAFDWPVQQAHSFYSDEKINWSKSGAYEMNTRCNEVFYQANDTVRLHCGHIQSDPFLKTIHLKNCLVIADSILKKTCIYSDIKQLDKHL